MRSKTLEESFHTDFPHFKAKIEAFVDSTNFYANKDIYEDISVKIASISPDDLKESIRTSVEFVRAREQSLDLIQKAVKLYQGLDEIFTMDEESLGVICEYDLTSLERRVEKELKEAADLLRQFEIASEKSRKIIESLEDPFLSQGL